MTSLFRNRPKYALGVALAAALACAFTWSSGFGGLTDALRDARFAFAQRPASGQVVLVDIDEKSIASIGIWPWPRTVHASIVDQLAAAGASEIAFDVDFSSRTSEEADAGFEAALRNAQGSVVLAAERQRLSAAAPALSLVVPLKRFSGQAWLALADVLVDHDGLIRAVPASASAGGETIPSLSSFLAGANLPDGASFRIDYGINASSIDHISVADLLSGSVPAARLAGKKIIVGASSVALRDYFNVPRYGVIQGSLVHALATETLVQGRALVSQSSSIRAGGMAVLILACLLILCLLPSAAALTASFGLAVLLEIAALVLQRHVPISLNTTSWHLVLVVTALAVVAREILERGTLWKTARAEKRATQAILDRVFEDSFSAIIVADAAGNIRAASAEALRMFSIGPLSANFGSPAQTRLPPALAALFSKDSTGSPTGSQGIVQLGGDPGGEKIFEYTRSASRFPGKAADDPEREAICVTLQDITQRRRAEERIESLARIDGLTGLPNRNSFVEQLSSVGSRTGTSLLLIDIDRFKSVNDAMGQPWSDAALQHLAWHLAIVAGPTAFIARTDGDEFALLTGTGEARAIAEKIVEMLEQPLDIGGRRALLSASIGIAELGAEAGSETAVRRAGLALSEAKAAGGRVIRQYLPGTEAKLVASEALEAELQLALERGEFRVFYQPQTSFAAGGTIGAEGLIRWQHPERGLVSPGEFIPLLEKTQLIVPVGKWVLQQSCTDAANWPAHVRVAVNVAVTQLISGDFAATVAEILAQTGLDSARLDLELTESLFIQDANIVAKVLLELRALGVGLALDDFGTGYSSLSYIKRYPFTKVKLDRAFVRDLPESRESVAIVQAVSAIARALDLKVVAEGVETEDQFNAVRLLGCDEVQGFLKGRPMPCAAFREHLDGTGKRAVAL